VKTSPAAMFEAKLSDTVIARSSHYFCDIFKVPFFQIVGADIKPEEYPGMKFVVPAWQILGLLG
jgi:hypothetical protein